MTFFERDSMINMVKDFDRVIYVILVPPIERQINDHWHETLKSNFKDLRDILIELNLELYEEISTGYFEKLEAKKVKRAELDSKWKILEDRIKESQPDFEAPTLPFKSDVVVADYNQLYSSVGQKDQNLSN